MKKIFKNGKIYTFDRNQPFVQAVVVENGRFIDIGSTDEMILQWGRSDTKIVDLEGKAVTPGLIDSHLHLSLIAKSFLQLDVTGVSSKEALLQKIQLYASELDKDEWIVGRGWDENLFKDASIPTIEELDRVAPHHPLFLTRICEHAHLVNSKALEISGYHPTISVPDGGQIVRDPRTNKPTGLLLETASEMITRNIPPVPYNKLKEALKKAMQYVIKQGLTSVHTNDPRSLGGFNQTYQMYDELLNKDDIGLRCNLLIDHPFLPELKKNSMYAGFGNETLQIGAVKIFADGAFGRRTALLSEAYSDAPDIYGEAIHDQETLYEIVRQARSLNMPVAAHTIGDQAVENVLNILDQFPSVAYRDRLIHTSVLRGDLIERLVDKMKVIDVQPRFLVSDFPWIQDRLGKRTRWAYPWKTLLNAGVLASGSSDAPIEPVNPLLGIHAAVTRRKPNETHEGYFPEEKLTVEEAFRLFTVMGAYPTNEEKIKGTISRGKLADMTVFSKDPFTLNDIDLLLETSVDMTVIGGKIR